MKAIKTFAIAFLTIASMSVVSCNNKAESNKDEIKDAVREAIIEAGDELNAQEGEDADEATAGKVCLILDFNATWCGPCKQFAPIFEAAAVKYPNIEFQSVDVDENPDMAQQFGVESIPMVVLLDEEGNVLDQSVGLIDAETFEQMIEQHI